MSFVSKRLFSTFLRSPIFKIEGQCYIRSDTSDTLVLKYTLELKRKWDIQSQDEIKKDVIHLYESPNFKPERLEELKPLDTIFEIEQNPLTPKKISESALSHIMKRYK